MFEKQSKIVTLDEIGNLCKSSKGKKSKPIQVAKDSVMAKPIREIPKKIVPNEDKSEEIILWL